MNTDFQDAKPTSMFAALSSSADTETRLTSDSAHTSDSAEAAAEPATQPPADAAGQTQDAPAQGEAAAADTDADVPFHKHPRWQQVQADLKAAQSRAQELEAKAGEAALYEADKPLYDEAKRYGYDTINEYLIAVQEQQERQEADQREQQTQQAKAVELQEGVDSGEITLEVAQRLFRAEQLAERTQSQQRQVTVNLNRQALKEVQSELPALNGRKDLLGVLEATLTNDSGADVIRTVGREVKAIHDAAKQEGYDLAMREMQDKAPAPAPLSASGTGYTPPGEVGDKKFTLFGALQAINQGRSG